jgi:hypothetical protein
MTETMGSPTRALFDSLARLYKQTQLLLMDSDRLMGERGWEPMHSTATAGLSYSLNSPERWYPRWLIRFYRPTTTKEDEPGINRILFISVQIASDVDTTLPTDVDEPLVCAGRLIYEKLMTLKEANDSYDYWMCKYWFIGKRHEKLEGWRTTGQSRWYENLKGSESFVVPLYDITSSEKLGELVINPLLAVQEREEVVT